MIGGEETLSSFGEEAVEVVNVEPKAVDLLDEVEQNLIGRGEIRLYCSSERIEYIGERSRIILVG